MNKKVTVGITLAFIFIAVALTFTATMMFSMNLFDQKIVSIQERESMYEKISEIDAIVRQNYYLGVDDDKLIDGLAKGYISGTGDDTIKYFSSYEIARINEMKSGKLCGIGVETYVNASGYVQITEVHESTSAEKIGVHSGDTIVAVNGEDALSLGSEAVINSLYGPDGEEVTLTYAREGTDYTFTFVYDVYETTSVKILDVDGYTYIRFTAFNELTYSQFDEMLVAALAEGSRGILIDLRNIDGGYDINVVAQILDKLVGQSTMISGLYKDGITKVLYTSDSNELNMPTAVIVNGNTIGYAELLAAVLGERDNVRIIGEPTYGLGTYRVLTQLPDGTGLYVPVCELLAAGSVRFNGTGVTPDFLTASFDDFVLSDDEPDIVRDLQLRKAIEVLQSEFQ